MGRMMLILCAAAAVYGLNGCASSTDANVNVFSIESLIKVNYVRNDRSYNGEQKERVPLDYDTLGG